MPWGLPLTPARAVGLTGLDLHQLNMYLFDLPFPVLRDSRSELNDQLQARAFTTGSDVFFRKGDYQPTSHEGQELLAHELTHVVQQGGAGPVQPTREED